MSGAITVRILFPISPCWAWKSSCASWVERSKLFCLVSISFTSLSRDGFVQFVLLGAELLLEAVDFVGLGLELVLLGLKFLGELGEIALSLVGEEDRLFDVDGADFGARSLSRCRGSSRRRIGSSGSRGAAAGAAWARAKRERPNTEATVRRTNLLRINLLVFDL
jgi:hypothetical protein